MGDGPPKTLDDELPSRVATTLDRSRERPTSGYELSALSACSQITVVGEDEVQVKEADAFTMVPRRVRANHSRDNPRRIMRRFVARGRRTTQDTRSGSSVE